jgi:hypothetical protein
VLKRLPLRFDFITYDVLELGLLVGVIIANTFLVLGGYILRKDDLNLKYVNYLLIVGGGLLLFSILDIFLPDVNYFSAEGSDVWKDTRYGYTYDFVRFQCFELALLVTLGMTFVLIALTSSQLQDKLLLLAGGLLSLASFMSLVNWGMYYFLVWLWPQDLLIYFDFFVPWQLFNLFMSLIAYGLFSLFSFRIEQRFLVVFGVLTFILLLFGIWNFIEIFGVFS